MATSIFDFETNKNAVFFITATATNHFMMVKSQLVVFVFFTVFVSVGVLIQKLLLFLNHLKFIRSSRL